MHPLRIKEMASRFLLFREIHSIQQILRLEKQVMYKSHNTTTAVYKELLGNKSVKGIRHFIPTEGSSCSQGIERYSRQGIQC